MITVDYLRVQDKEAFSTASKGMTSLAILEKLLCGPSAGTTVKFGTWNQAGSAMAGQG